MHCPNCNNKFESGKFCPECGVALVEDVQQQAPSSGVSLNLGDANAISGGVHVANTTNVQNTYIHEREKSESELEQEKRIKFMSLCEKVFEDGILENYEVVRLEDERIKLGLDKETANLMIELARKSCQNLKTTLAARDAITMKIINMQIQKNDVNQIKAQFPKLEAIHNIYKNDSVECTYYMLLSTLFPERLIEMYEKSEIDDYWQTFWAVIAYMKKGGTDKAEKTTAKLSWFTRYPESNDLLLSALNSNMEFGPDIAKDYLTIVEAEPCSPELNYLYHALLFEIDSDKAISCGINGNEIAYYLDTILHMEDPRTKAAAIEKEKEDKIKYLEESFMKISEEYGNSKAAKKFFQDQIRTVLIDIDRKKKEAEENFGWHSPEYKNIEAISSAIWTAKKLGKENLWEVRKSLSDNHDLTIILDDYLLRFVESEMQPGKEEERRHFRETAEKQEQETEIQLKEYEEAKARRIRTKAMRDKKAPLLGEAFQFIKELKDDKTDYYYKEQIRNIYWYFSRKQSSSLTKEIEEEYRSASWAVNDALGMGCKDLWSLREMVKNDIVKEAVDDALETIIRQECKEDDEFRQWFEKKEEIFLEEIKKEIKVAQEKEQIVEERNRKDKIFKGISEDFYLKFRGNLKRLKSRLAANVCAHPEDDDARKSYETVKGVYRTISNYQDPRFGYYELLDLKETLIDFPSVVEEIDEFLKKNEPLLD